MSTKHGKDLLIAALHHDLLKSRRQDTYLSLVSIALLLRNAFDESEREVLAKYITENTFIPLIKKTHHELPKTKTIPSRGRK